MIFGKYINKYYVKYGWLLILGIIALIAVDYFQLEIPEFYGMVINGIRKGEVEIDGVVYPFDGNFLIDRICMPMLVVILVMVVGRFLWRVCFLGSGIKVEANIRMQMFDHCRNLSQQYYQVNKVGNLMSLFTNDLETIQECFGWGVLMLGDAVFLGGLAIMKMAQMNLVLTLFSLIPMAFLLAMSLIVGKYLMDKWDKRQAAFSSLSDFSIKTNEKLLIKTLFYTFIKLFSRHRFSKIKTLNHVTSTIF